MRTDDFYYFLEICKYGSINAAAKHNFISQAALSNILKNMEAELGFALFERNTHKLEITELGLQFYNHAKSIIKIWNNILELKTNCCGSDNLSILYGPSSFISQCLFDFQKKHPCYEGSDLFIEDMILNNFSDLEKNHIRMILGYFTNNRIDKLKSQCHQHNLEVQILQDGFPLFLLVSKKHPLAKKSSITWEECLGYPIVKYKNLSYTDEFGVSNEFQETSALYVNNRSAFIEAIKTHNFVSTSFYISKEVSQNNGLTCIPIQGKESSITMFMITRSDYEFNPREKCFLNSFRCSLNSYYKSITKWRHSD